MQAHGDALGGNVRAGRAARVRAGTAHATRPRATCSSTAFRWLDGLDEPRRPGRHARPRASGSWPAPRTARRCLPPRRFAASTACSSTRRSSHTAARRDASSPTSSRRRGARGDWTPAAFVDEQVAKIRAQVGDEHVICGLSGGVDSSVAAVLIHRPSATSSRASSSTTACLRAGRVRPGRRRRSATTSASDLHAVDARERFLAALAGVTDPEEKRKIIGAASSTSSSRPRGEMIAEKGVRRASSPRARSTPTSSRRCRSRRPPSVTIKSHHNVGGLPEKHGLRAHRAAPRALQGRGARASAASSALPERIVWRQPFPGPGLAIRCLGEVTAARLRVLREADAIVLRRDRAPAASTTTVWQAFAVLLPVQSVGVMGDARTYEDVLALRAVDERRRHDGRLGPPAVRAARPHAQPHHQRGARHQPRRLRHLSKPPATIEWE